MPAPFSPDSPRITFEEEAERILAEPPDLRAEGRPFYQGHPRSEDLRLPPLQRTYVDVGTTGIAVGTPAEGVGISEGSILNLEDGSSYVYRDGSWGLIVEAPENPQVLSPQAARLQRYLNDYPNNVVAVTLVAVMKALSEKRDPVPEVYRPTYWEHLDDA